MVSSSGGYGLNLASNTGYRENVVNGGTPSEVTGGVGLGNKL
jgi:hypothetical protein